MTKQFRPPPPTQYAEFKLNGVDVGSILRVKHNGRIRLFKVTGIHIGAIEQESVFSVRSLDLGNATAYGKTVEEAMIPIALLETNPSIEVL